MNNEKLIELLKLIKEVNSNINDEDRMDKIHHISSYGAYLYYTNQISSNDFINSINCIKNDTEDIKYYFERNEYIKILLSSNSELNKLFRNTLEIYWNYIINDVSENINTSIDSDLIEFLKYINCYNLYLDIKNNNQIAYESNILKHSVCLDNRDNSYIIIKNKNNFHNCLDISHEIAHALENKLLSKYKRCFDSPYNVEILSITFNRMFIEYLYQNNRIKSNEYLTLLNNFETNYFSFIRLSLFISDSIYSGYYSINDYDISIYCEEDIINRSLTDYNYAIGRICAFKLFDEWQKNDYSFIKNIPNLVSSIYHMSISDIINNFGNNSELINNELNKIFKKNIKYL